MNFNLGFDYNDMTDDDSDFEAEGMYISFNPTSKDAIWKY